MKSVENRVISRIYGYGRGSVFSQMDFADLGTRAAVSKALQRLMNKGIIRRLLRGIYDYPKYSQVLEQVVPPGIDQVAIAIARKNKWNIQATGSTALNLLGLSTQVPGRFVYMSTGPNVAYQVDSIELEFFHTAIKDAGFKLRESALLVEGLKSLGQERITDSLVTQMKKTIPDHLKPKILKDTKAVLSWVRDRLLLICQENDR